MAGEMKEAASETAGEIAQKTGEMAGEVKEAVTDTAKENAHDAGEAVEGHVMTKTKEITGAAEDKAAAEMEKANEAVEKALPKVP